MWFDIESAPKDGTEFIATGYDYGVKGDNRHFVVTKYDQGIFVNVDNEVDHGGYTYLDWWMPLPPPPKEK